MANNAALQSDFDSYFARLDQAVDYLVLWLQIKGPKKTGNLTMNAIRKVYNPDNGLPMIVIGGELAPYAIYTNEPWLAKSWNGATNPNLYWIQKAVIEAQPTLIMIMSGAMTMNEYNEIMSGSSYDLSDSLNMLAAAKGATV